MRLCFRKKRCLFFCVKLISVSNTTDIFFYTEYTFLGFIRDSPYAYIHSSSDWNILTMTIFIYAKFRKLKALFREFETFFFSSCSNMCIRCLAHTFLLLAGKLFCRFLFYCDLCGFALFIIYSTIIIKWEYGFLFKLNRIKYYENVIVIQVSFFQVSVSIATVGYLVCTLRPMTWVIST